MILNIKMIIGPPLCGKTTLSKYIKDKYKYNLIDFERI